MMIDITPSWLYGFIDIQIYKLRVSLAWEKLK